MDNFRLPYKSTCTSRRTIEKLEQAGLLPGVKNPTYSDIVVALSEIGYICYAEPLETIATASGMCWSPVLAYRKKGSTSLVYEQFLYWRIQCEAAIDESINKALDIIISKEKP